MFLDQSASAIASRNLLVPELPIELLLEIITMAAQRNKTSCYNLALVSRLFNECAQPLIYDRLDCLTTNSITCLRSLIFTSKPHDFFTTQVHTKSMSVWENIPMSLMKPILARCSRRLIVFSAHSSSEDNPGRYLPLVRSPCLRRLCLTWHHPICATPITRESPYSLYNQIPLEVLRTLTHLIAYTPHNMTSDWWVWHILINAWPTNELRHYWTAFHRLTHLAMSAHNIYLIEHVSRPAINLLYIVVFEDGDKHWNRERLESRIRRNNDRRFILIDKRGVADRDLIDSGSQNEFWTRIENLVGEGLLSDFGARWDDEDEV